MTTLTANPLSTTPLNMLSWDFTYWGTGTVPLHTGNKVQILSTDGKTLYTITGTNLYFNGSPFAAGSVVTGYKVQDVTGGTAVDKFSLTGMHIDGLTFNSILGTANGIFEQLAFAGNDHISGTAGDDILNGIAGNDSLAGLDGDDVIEVHNFGQTIVDGGAGDDIIDMLGTLSANDIIWGGSGYDTVFLDGDYSTKLQLNGNFMGIEDVVLAAGHSYTFAFQNLNIDGGTTTVDGSALGAGDSLTVRASLDPVDALVLIGGAGKDSLQGGTANDVFDLTYGGNDKVDGGDGNDTINFGAQFTSADRYDGGSGFDTMLLAGNYSLITLNRASHIEAIKLAGFHADIPGGHYAYKIVLKDIAVQNGDALLVDGSDLAARHGVYGTDALNFDGSDESSADLHVISNGGGDDVIKGGGGNDDLTSSGGGIDWLIGGGGGDVITFLTDFTSKDKVDGGAGGDTLALDGDFGNVVFKASTMKNVEFMTLGAGHDYHLALHDGNVAAGETLSVTGLGALDNVYFDGSAEFDGTLNFETTGDGAFIGGWGWDQMIKLGDGIVSFQGNFGNDTLYEVDSNLAHVSFSVDDSFDGGLQFDQLYLSGDFGALHFNNGTVTNVEVVWINYHPTADYVQGNYDLTLADGNIAAGGEMAVNAEYLATTGLDASHTLRVNDAAESDGWITVVGGSGDDVLEGGHGMGDSLDGGVGNDTYVYENLTQSSAGNFDSVLFDPLADKFDLWFSVTGVDAPVVGGSLTVAGFEADLETALPSVTELGANHAVVFNPTSGDYGPTAAFLIVDVNGVGGYQAGQDLVIQLPDFFSVNDLDTGDFV